MFYVCSLHVLCIVLMSIIHSHIVKHDVGGGNHGCVRWNVHLVERYFRSNKINIFHPVTNFYATLVSKTFLRVLTNDFYASNRPSRDMIQISNFRKRRDCLHASMLSLTRFYA
jgi:hypothetical protein